MSDYVRGWTTPPPTANSGISLAGFGIPSSSIKQWAHLQGKFENEVTPCANRPEWLSNRAADKTKAIAGCGACPAKHACREFAETNNESFGIWGGHDFSKGKP